ncbi:MAG: hydrolase [Gammaproteobacteria bacterium]
MSLSKEWLEVLKTWVDQNSGSRNILGLKKMADVLEKAFLELKPHQHARRQLPGFKHLNLQGQIENHVLGELLSFSKRPKAPIQLMCVGHYDTVFPQDSKFQKFKVNPKKTECYGPGVADMKGGLLLLLESLKYLESNPALNHLIGWTVWLNPDEEIGSPGSKYYLEKYSNPQHIALVFEPAVNLKGDVSAGRYGSGKWQFLVQGQSAHVGRNFKEGKHAIAAASELTLALHDLNTQNSNIILNVGLIQGGRVVNAVPDYTVLMLDVRFKEQEEITWLEQQFADIKKNVMERSGCKIELQGHWNRPVKAFDKKQQIWFKWQQSLARDLGQNLEYQTNGGGADSNNLAHQGMVVLDSLGVSGGRLHSDQEFMRIESMAERYALITKIFDNLPGFLYHV